MIQLEGQDLNIKREITPVQTTVTQAGPGDLPNKGVGAKCPQSSEEKEGSPLEMEGRLWKLSWL